MIAAAIGIDIGGTKIAAGVVDVAGTVVRQVRRETPQPGALVDVVAELVQELDPDGVCAGVGLAVAAIVGRDRRIIAATNLPGIDPYVGETLSARVNRPVIVENDANAAAWAEHRFGAGMGATHLLMVTVGTGIGGGIVLNGELLRGGAGAAAEIGHLCVVPDGRMCGCGQRGCLEQYASGRALDRGMPLAEAAAWLGRGLATLTAVLDPDLIVLGGGVADLGPELADPARAALAEYLPNRGERLAPPVVTARLGNSAGVVGVADLVRRAAS